ncbi:MAG: hypothetical protein NVSMB46_09000 [Candidatus Saccharimonadales bacterium]
MSIILRDNYDSGQYVIAVSGGIDSVVLLHWIVQHEGISAIIAHFDHGIRADSRNDRIFVESLSRKYNVPFEYEEGKLHPSTSEEAARKVRYAYLNKIKDKYHAIAVMTAHHRDDVVETAIINIIRGTHRRGLSSLRSGEIIRPFINTDKSLISTYARENNLQWRDDSTNVDTKYLRNYIRKNIVPRLNEHDKMRFLKIIDNSKKVNDDLDNELTAFIKTSIVGNRLRRYDLIMLPHEVAKEVVAVWLRVNNVRDYDKKTLERLVIACKTFLVHRIIVVRNCVNINVEREYLALTINDR